MTSTVPLAVSKWSSAFIKFLKQKVDQDISEEYSGIGLKNSLMHWNIECKAPENLLMLSRDCEHF